MARSNFNPALRTRLRDGGIPDHERFVGRVAGAALPSGLADLATDWGPDLAMAGLYAASLPAEYASGPERLGVGLEDATLGIGGSMLGRAVVTAAAMPFVGHRAARGIGQWVGGMAGGMGASMFGPRPFSGGIDRRVQEQAEEQRRLREEALIAQGIEMGAQQVSGSHPVQALDYLLGGYG